MTTDQYIAAIKALGLSQVAAAEFLGVSRRTSHGYANGAPIPAATGKLLWIMAIFGASAAEVDARIAGKKKIK